MPRGVYIKRKSPSKKQLEALKIAHKLPRSEKQMEHAHQNIKEGKCRIFANDIVKHHNDLCRGKLRPDDITLMTLSEHFSLHTQYRKRDRKGRFIAVNDI